MRSKQLRFGEGFRVAFSNRRSQAAEMVIAPGDAEGGPDNRHRGSDQWLYVLSGTGTAMITGKRRTIRAGTLLLIERGDTHEIRNTGQRLLRTLKRLCPASIHGERRAVAPWSQVVVGQYAAFLNVPLALLYTGMGL
jgi:mannose-6-phosphate isomerase-like protein (cupin superfamily)